MTGGGDRRHDAPDLDGGVGVARERTGVRNRMERNGGEGERQELSAPRRRRRQWRGGGRHRTEEAAHGFDEKDRFAFPPLRQMNVIRQANVWTGRDESSR
jgi:hypothetical protein